MKQSPVGIEINEHFLKIVTAAPFVKQEQINDCIVKPISGLTDKQITDAIAEVFRDLKLRPSPLVLSVPRNFVTVRNLHLPSEDKNEIAQMLQLHIGRIVPYKKEEVVFNYSLLGHDEMNYMKVLLVIAHNDILKRQMNILQAADLYIDRIDLGSFGAWEWALATQKNEINANDIYLLLDIDSTFTDFIVFNRTHLLFTRSIAVETTAQLQAAQVTKLIGEVKQSLVIFHNEEQNKNPAKIFLAGAHVIADLQKTMQGELDIEIKNLAFPFAKAMLDTKKRQIPENVSLTAVSELTLEDTGKRVTFILPEIQIRKSLRDRTRDLTILGALILYFFSALVAFFWGKFYNQQNYLNKLIEQNTKIDKEMGGVLGQYRKTEFVRNYLYHRRLPLAFISELQKITPPQIAMNAITMDESGKVTLRGQGVQLADVFRYVSVVEGSKYFKDVATKYTRSKKVKDKEITDFEVSFQPEVPVERPMEAKAEKK
ncbi:MAG: pilus assembly protein PilM [Candidatus Omnitrophica bacterium]|nr:pilus assembly protein PilM [Candidatus Omnitrophota bacterium]